MSELFEFEKYIDITQEPSAICNLFRIPIGVAEGGMLGHAELRNDRGHNILVSGRCGSGKSMYLHTIVNSSMLSYTPDCLSIWIYDGTMCEFSRYSGAAYPHITHFGGGDDCSVLLPALEQEMERRRQILAETRSCSYERYIKECGCIPFPRLLVVVDSFDYLLSGLCDENSYNHRRMVNLLRMASPFGITFAVSVQDLEIIPAVLLEMFEIRVALSNSPDSFRALFNNQKTPQLRAGEAWVNIPTFHKTNLLYLSPESFRLIEDAIHHKHCG